GWLFEQGHSFGKLCKLSTLTSRFNIGLKKALISLMQNGIGDLRALNNPTTWHKFEESLKDLKTSKRTLELAFTALQAVSRLNYWLPFQLELPNISYKQLARKLANKNKFEHMQA
ncbi:ABC transporter permease, partial [Vibrio parahaemolyticus]